MFVVKKFIPRTHIYNEVFFTSNGDRMPRLRPREVDVPIYPNEAHCFGDSSPRVRLLVFGVFHCFSIINRPFILIVM